jgi:hypothetical protein
MYICLGVSGCICFVPRHVPLLLYAMAAGHPDATAIARLHVGDVKHSAVQHNPIATVDHMRSAPNASTWLTCRYVRVSMIVSASLTCCRTAGSLHACTQADMWLRCAGGPMLLLLCWMVQVKFPGAPEYFILKLVGWGHPRTFPPSVNFRSSTARFAKFPHRL